ncbi:MAG: ABC transporter ATP-binding protein [Synergistetes bacterium]|nr:ABC transporter ATP-binding protein [Synergistota bacterium]
MHAVELKGITKRFERVVANDDVNVEVQEGEIHAIVGENGAGKSTLMKVLYGYYQKDSGIIRIFGKEIEDMTPHKAISLGIGMVHQEFMLIPPLKVVENIILGSEPRRGIFIDEKKAKDEVSKLTQQMGFDIDLNAETGTLPVGIQQKIEILKILYRGAKILILDEPTAVLTPQEVDELFNILKNLKKTGKTVILITHKLQEVMAVSDRVTVMKTGKVVGKRLTKETSPEELAEMMVGRKVLLKVEKPPRNKGKKIVEVKELWVKDELRGIEVVKGVSFDVHEGEIVGIAGVAGNGQTELVEALSGMRKVEKGNILIDGMDMANRTPKEVRLSGVAHIPEDRKGMGLVMDYTMAENITIGRHDMAPFSKGIVMDKTYMLNKGKELAESFDIRPPEPTLEVKFFSGGNQQKIIVAREFDCKPKFLIASQPTRGLDIGAIEYVYRYLLKAREEGKAILLVSMELEEVLSLSDRLLVMFNGEIVGNFDSQQGFDISLIGNLMMQGKVF